MHRVTNAYGTGPGESLPVDPRDMRIAELEGMLFFVRSVLKTNAKKGSGVSLSLVNQINEIMPE